MSTVEYGWAIASALVMFSPDSLGCEESQIW